MSKRVKLEQIDHTRMKERHDELVLEMLRRGYNHNSPYIQPDVSYIKEIPCINIEYNIRDLSDRCNDCKKLLNGDVK